MDNTYTEHVLERARDRQRKLAPLRETNFTSAVQPSIAAVDEVVKTSKDIVSSPIPGTPKLTKSNSKTKIYSNITSNPNGQEINTLNIQRDSLNMNICFSSNENVRVEVEIHSDEELPPNTIKVNVEETSTESNDNAPVLRKEVKTRLQKLGKLYSGSEDLSSPISNSAQPRINLDTDVEVAGKCKARRGLHKLAELAKDINQWEDDISSSRKNQQETKPTTPKKWKPPAPQPPKESSPKKFVASHGKPQASKPPAPQSQQEEKENEVLAKQLVWDKSVLHALEQQGFTRTTSNSRLVYNFEHSQNKPSSEQTTQPKKIVSTAKMQENVTAPRSPMRPRGGIASRAAMFENNAVAPASPKKEKDPALLSVTQRKALFERNKGEALVPKAAFAMAAPITKIQPVASTSSELNKKPEAPVLITTSKKEAGNIAEKIALLNQCASETTISQQQIEDKVRSDRQKDMDVLLNRFAKNKTVTSQAPLDAIESCGSEDSEDEVSEEAVTITSKPVEVIKPEVSCLRKSGGKRSQSRDSPQVEAVLEDVKRIKVTQPKVGKLYPNLSDIEATTETETEVTASSNNSSLDNSYSDSEKDANTSLSREVMGVVHKHDQQYKEKQKRVSDYSTDSAVSDALADISQYLNNLDCESPGPTPPKHGKLLSPQKSTPPSQSLCYKKFSPRKQKSSPNKFQSPCKVVRSPRKDSGNLPTFVMDGTDALPLTHTVSFYRKQQTQGSTPVRQITRQPMVDDYCEDTSKDALEIQNKLEILTREVNKQTMVISQASNALNLCISTSEFTGSTEQVEAEKLLLLASHRKQAATLEIQRLQVQKTLRPQSNLPVERGTLVISNISLPLKKEYTKALAAAGGKGHHVVCLVKYEEDIIDTPLVSTVATSTKHSEIEFKIPGRVKLKNVFSDFRVTLEVYCLQAQEEILPHEVKYRIGKKASSKMTPRKAKQENRMLHAPKDSPAGPQAVRTSAFALNGFTILSLQTMNQTQWTLNQMPPMSPLEGTISMRLHCEFDVSVEHRGFLNMFEDISGLGAWHRRWCLLKGKTISYWKYPEDERKKAPIDTINLNSCITKTVGPVSRDICARLHTFLLERERAAQPQDRETLTVCHRGDKTIIRHLLSADTKEERIEWCTNLNKALMAMRMCGGGHDTNFTEL